MTDADQPNRPSNQPAEPGHARADAGRFDAHPATPSTHPRERRDRSLGVDREVRTAGSPRDPSATLALAVEVARELKGDKCENILVLNLSGLSQVTDAFVIASGTSDRQMRSAGEHVIELARKHGVSNYKENLREPGAKWIIIDFVDLVVHLFEPDTRVFYDLEMLWGDAKRVDWRRPGEQDEPTPDDRRNRAGLRDDDILPDRP